MNVLVTSNVFMSGIETHELLPKGLFFGSVFNEQIFTICKNKILREGVEYQFPIKYHAILTAIFILQIRHLEEHFPYKICYLQYYAYISPVFNFNSNVFPLYFPFIVAAFSLYFVFMTFKRKYDQSLLGETHV